MNVELASTTRLFDTHEFKSVETAVNDGSMCTGSIHSNVNS